MPTTCGSSTNMEVVTDMDERPWRMERVGHPHLDITIRHHTGHPTSHVFQRGKMVGGFVGPKAQYEARRHAQVLISAEYEKNGSPNGDVYRSQP